MDVRTYLTLLARGSSSFSRRATRESQPIMETNMPAPLCPSSPVRERGFRERLAALFCASILSLVLVPRAQGTFVNFETPSVKPIDVAKIGNAWYVLVCNNADNSVEVFSAATNAPLLRIPVGQNPVTVRWNAALSAFYTCNWIGDSVTKVSLVPGSGSTPLVASVLATTFVGDEPADIAFRADNATMIVSLNSRSSYVLLSTANLGVIGGERRFGNTAAPAQHTKSLDQPRRVLRANQAGGSTERFFALGTRNRSVAPANFQYDLLTFDLDSAGTVTQVNPLSTGGTSAFGIAQSSDGRLWGVKNSAATNVLGESALSSESTGFVKSQIFVFDAPGTSGALPATRNLNLTPSNQETAAHQMSMPTDLAVIERNGQVQRIFVASFQSDRIGIVTVNGQASSQIASWPVTSIDMRPALTSGYSVVGPRAFALKPFDASVPGDPNPRLFVANTLMPSFSVFDPTVTNPTPVTVLLQNDPTPTAIRTGRRGLYDARLSGKQFVACASCHFDAGTDGLAWRLEVTNPSTPFPLSLRGDGAEATNATWPGDKGPMVTQNLHGLVNHVVAGRAQELFSNKPYHWRADRADFLAFNPAFVALLGAANQLSTSDMLAFRDFINTCVYPPNPEQSLERVVPGDPGLPNNVTSGSGAARGKKLFHIVPLLSNKFNNRSCSECHSGVAGSNSRITDADTTGGSLQPLEAAAIRSLGSREARLETGLNPSQVVSTGDIGLQHSGARKSINQFHTDIFAGLIPGPGQLDDIIAFARQFDTGIAPVVGRSFTVTSSNASSQAAIDAFSLAARQALAANAGAAAYARINGVVTRYWLDATTVPPLFRVEGGVQTVSVTALRTSPIAPTDVVILQSTPLGSERRIASISGTATPIVDLTHPPANALLEPMQASSHWQDVATQTDNANPAPAAGLTKSRFLQTLEVYRTALGMPLPHRHEPPRRFVVSGDDIRPGAVLELSRPLSLPPTTNVALITLPIFPTSQRTASGKVIWMTTAEIDPIFLYQLLLGGAAAPGVQDAFDSQTPEADYAAQVFTFSPTAWNKYKVVVRNEDGTSNASTATWQPLTMP